MKRMFMKAFDLIVSFRWLRLWARHETIREHESKRDEATSICQVEGKTYQFRAPVGDDLVDIMLIGKDDEKRLEHVKTFQETKLPADCTVEMLSNQLKMSPQEMAECFPNVIARVDHEFVWATKDWYGEYIQMLARSNERAARDYVNFQFSNDGISTIATDDINDAEMTQCDFFLRKAMQYLPNHWAKRNGHRANVKPFQSLIASAKKTARSQIGNRSGVDLNLPAPINRDFDNLQESWRRLINPPKAPIFPPQTEYDYAVNARMWLIEMEAKLFGSAVKHQLEREEAEERESMAQNAEKREEYKNIATQVHRNQGKR